MNGNQNFIVESVSYEIPINELLLTSNERWFGCFGIPACPEFASDERNARYNIESDHSYGLSYSIDHCLRNEWTSITSKPADTPNVRSIVYSAGHFITLPHTNADSNVGIYQYDEW